MEPISDEMEIIELNQLYSAARLKPDDFIKNLYLGTATPVEQRQALRLIVKAGPVMSVILPREAEAMADDYVTAQLDRLQAELIREKRGLN